jgi:uncharacterized DUF497 family protein
MPQARPFVQGHRAVLQGSESRWKAIGRLPNGRFVFVVFTFREVVGRRIIRPISARYMHRKEVLRYVQDN